MNTIPLVKGNTQEEINTSLIALKKALDEMNSSSGKTDASVQSQIKQINELIENINTQIEGLQPVDFVTSGNMQPVTSNAVSRAMSFSTEEVNTGKKWIDGKPIYKATVNCGALPNNTDKTIANALSNVDTVIKLTGMASDGTAQISIPYSASANVNAYVYNNDVHIVTNNNLSSYSKSHVIIEYTKTV